MQRLNRRSAMGRLACAVACPTGAVAAPIEQPVTSRPLQVVASFSILADWLRNVGGSAVNVHALVGANADAHVFEPSPQDARRLKEADLVVVNGLGFEGWINRLIQASGYRGTVLTASAGIHARQQGGSFDPHVWQSLTHAARCVENLRDALIRAVPNEAAAIAQRSAQYVAQLNALDDLLRARFAAIPKAQRRVITSHDAFGYLGAAYDIEFLSPQGMSTGSEASAASVARLIEQIRSQSVRAVFVENISDPRLVRRLAQEGGAAVGGRLYSDALSLPGTEADTYLKLFAHNAAALAAGMQGGMQGRKAARPQELELPRRLSFF
jgi:zinc/manganese transport system substrate-binding protein